MFFHGVAGCESSRICVLRVCLKFIIALPEILDAHYVFWLCGPGPAYMA